MHFNQGSPFNCSNTIPNSQEWDPDVVLGLTNENINNDSCIGWAKTCGRRCKRWIAKHKTTYGHNILNNLACDSASKAAESSRLRDAANILLCWQHTNQASDILKQWRRKLEDWDEDNKTYVKVEAIEDLSAKESIQRLRQMDEKWQRSGKYATGGNIPPQNIKREEDDRQTREKKRREQEKQRREEEEKQRREEEEKQRREEEEKQRREEEEKQRQKKEEERKRERARLAKEKREREAREKAERKAAEWRTAWERYSKAWSKTADVSVTNIPWPVQSGLQSDVNEANVRLFFAKAPPAELVDSGDKRFKLISAENLRWHTDKVMQRFGPDAVDGAAKGPLGIIAKVVIELRQEARKGRH
ncbi:hypothetical protein F4781DRAFT_45359 [Annulohypoxylon bovei var. microspora]|nr:hypothetical protein F4781DRAFT_45359 [Annulohypoxylon bovei var. microspora]